MREHLNVDLTVHFWLRGQFLRIFLLERNVQKKILKTLNCIRRTLCFTKCILGSFQGALQQKKDTKSSQVGFEDFGNITGPQTYCRQNGVAEHQIFQRFKAFFHT